MHLLLFFCYLFPSALSPTAHRPNQLQNQSYRDFPSSLPFCFALLVLVRCLPWLLAFLFFFFCSWIHFILFLVSFLLVLLLKCLEAMTRSITISVYRANQRKGTEYDPIPIFDMGMFLRKFEVDGDKDTFNDVGEIVIDKCMSMWCMNYTNNEDDEDESSRWIWSISPYGVDMGDKCYAICMDRDRPLLSPSMRVLCYVYNCQFDPSVFNKESKLSPLRKGCKYLFTCGERHRSRSLFVVIDDIAPVTSTMQPTGTAVVVPHPIDTIKDTQSPPVESAVTIKHEGRVSVKEEPSSKVNKRKRSSIDV